MTEQVTADELRQFVERYERLEAEKQDIADQQKEVMAEAKGRGYDTKALRKIIADRKKTPDQIAEEGWHIRDHAALQSALAHIGQAQPPFVLTLKPGEETRRDRQNRFAFEALGDRETDEVRAETKLRIGVPILRSEDDYFRERYDSHAKGLPYETKLALMVEPFDFPVTRLMTVKQMNTYITKMLAYWDAQGASVMLPEYDL